MKHTFVVLILLVGISMKVSGQTDTIPAILEDDTSKETADTSVFFKPDLDYEGQYTLGETYKDNNSNNINTTRISENVMTAFADFGGGYSIFQNKNFSPKSYSNTNLQMSVGLEITPTDALLIMEIPFGFSLPAEPFLFGNLGRLENADSPSFYRGYLEFKSSYLRKLKNEQHLIGAELKAGSYGRMFADTASTIFFNSERVNIHDDGIAVASIGVAYMYQTSIKNRPLNIYFSLPLFITQSGFFGKRFSADEYYFSDVGTLNKHLAPTFKVELANVSRKINDTGWSIAYECRLQNAKYSTRTTWINDFMQTLCVRYYFYSEPL